LQAREAGSCALEGNDFTVEDEVIARLPRQGLGELRLRVNSRTVLPLRKASARSPSSLRS
jgi:hypothetical protein